MDAGASLAGALVLARALDEAIPSLLARLGSVPATRPRPVRRGRCAPGAVHRRPWVQHLYRGRPLLIDLGGDDVHANSAGGADLDTLNEGGNDLPVSVIYEVPDADHGDRREEGVVRPDSW